MRRNIFQIIHVVVTLALAAYIFLSRSSEKKAYVDNRRVFDEFSGKVMLQKKLDELNTNQKRQLDSVARLINGKDVQIYENMYYQMSQEFAATYESASTKYTADIWKTLNGYISEYGKKNDYDFIFGATGDGSLMYANQVRDITSDVIEYVNEEYAKD